MDLFTPQVPADRLHPYFRELVSRRNSAQLEVLRSWAEGFVDRDGKFVIEFQTTFNSSFWELYLHVAFGAIGARLDYSANRPDFQCEFPGGQSFVAEAVIASNASEYVPEWQGSPLDQVPLDAMLEYSSIRLANALSAKVKKYRKEYITLAHVTGKPFLICIAPFEQRHFYALGDRALRRVLQGLDVPLVDFNESTGQPVLVGEAHTPSAWKPSGAEIEFGLFLSRAVPEVSGVIFSNTATFGKLTVLSDTHADVGHVLAVRYNALGSQPRIITQPINEYRETLLDGLHLFLNPFATRPLDPAPFTAAGCAIHALSSDGTVIDDVPDNFLFSRVTARLIPRKTGDVPPIEPPWETVDSGLRTPTIEAFPDESLRRLGGNLGTSTDVHIAHYKGWTILTARDIFDGDWGGLACQGLYRDLAAWRTAAGGEEVKSMMIPDFFATKELAAAAVKAAIDAHEAADRNEGNPPAESPVQGEGRE